MKNTSEGSISELVVVEVELVVAEDKEIYVQVVVV